MDLSAFNPFLAREDVYHQAQRFWQNTIGEIFAGNQLETWMDNRYANGQEILDGNPIYSVFIPGQHQAIRIIQLDKTLENPILTVWTERAEYQQQLVKELVISLQLFAYTFQDAIATLRLFQQNRLSQARIDLLNRRYERRWEQKKLSYVANNRLLESIANKVATIVQGYDLNHWDKAVAEIDTIRLSFKNIEKSLPEDLHFTSGRVSEKFDRLKSSLEQLGDVITLGHTISTQPIKNYSTLIIRRHESPSKYVQLVKIEGANVSKNLQRIREASRKLG